MQFEILAASQRPNSQTLKVAQYIQSAIRRNFNDAKTGLTDLGTQPLPLWDSEFDEGPEWNALWQPLASRLQKADAFVFLTPEWAGMASPAIKNFFLLCSTEELGHKPALLVSVSAGRSGAYPIAELKLSSGKNNKVVYIPDHLIVRGVGGVLNTLTDQAPSSPEDELTRRRIDHSLLALNAYATALRQVRETPGLFEKDFLNGM